MWTAQSEEFIELYLNLQPLCGENVYETWLVPHDENRVLAIDLRSITTEYGHKTWLVPTNNFLYWPSAYGISILNIFWKDDSNQMK